MLVKVFGSAVIGVDAITITIEVDTPGGTTGYFIVGLPDNAVKESIERMVRKGRGCFCYQQWVYIRWGWRCSAGAGGDRHCREASFAADKLCL